MLYIYEALWHLTNVWILLNAIDAIDYTPMLYMSTNASKSFLSLPLSHSISLTLSMSISLTFLYVTHICLPKMPHNMNHISSSIYGISEFSDNSLYLSWSLSIHFLWSLIYESLSAPLLFMSIILFLVLCQMISLSLSHLQNLWMIFLVSLSLSRYLFADTNTQQKSLIIHSFDCPLSLLISLTTLSLKKLLPLPYWASCSELCSLTYSL